MIHSLLVPKEGKKAKKLWILVYLHHFLWNFEIRILLVNPLRYFQAVCTYMLPKRLRVPV